MKKKHFFSSKPFIAGSLAVLCVGVLAVCLVLNENEKSGFIPEPTLIPAPIEDWTEMPSSTEAEKETPDKKTPDQKVATNGATDVSPNEEYPKVVESAEDQVIVDFTDPTPRKTETPSVPEGKREITDPGSSHPVQKDPTVTKAPPKQEATPTVTVAPSKQKPKSATSAPGSKNEKGQIYDPIFGWVTPSKVEQEVIDGDGDPNKMVGEMD